MSVTHWAISNTNGSDSNSGLSSDMSNAKQTWDSLFTAITAAVPFSGPQVVHIGNASKFTLPSAITNVPYNSFNGDKPLVFYPYNEDAGGLFMTFPDGSTMPCWEIDTGGVAPFAGISNRPQYAKYYFGVFSGVSGSNAYDFGNYSEHYFVKFDASAVTGSYAGTNTMIMRNCHVICGDGAGAGALYGFSTGALGLVSNCLFEDSRGAGAWISGGTIENCVFRNNSCSVTSQGSLRAGGANAHIIRNCAFIGQGPTAGDAGIYQAVFYAQLEVENNIFMNVEDPVLVSTAYVARMTTNAFYNCGTNGVVKSSPATGWAGGLILPELEEAIVLDEDPFVNAAGGDYTLKLESLCRQRGSTLGPVWPGASFTAPPIVCDIGPVQHGARSAIVAPGYVG